MPKRHLRHRLAQVRDHFVHACQHLAEFVAGVDIRGVGQIALADACHHADGNFQRPRNTADHNKAHHDGGDQRQYQPQNDAAAAALNGGDNLLPGFVCLSLVIRHNIADGAHVLGIQRNHLRLETCDGFSLLASLTHCQNLVPAGVQSHTRAFQSFQQSALALCVR